MKIIWRATSTDPLCGLSTDTGVYVGVCAGAIVVRAVMRLVVRLILPMVVPVALSVTASMAVQTPVAAHHLVDNHSPRCNSVFPCSARMRPRISFWVQVFASWSTRDSVFHDSRHPEKVYSVLRTKTGVCSKRERSKRLNTEYARLRKMLDSLAKRMERGVSTFNREERHILNMFSDHSPAELNHAVRSIRCQQGNRDRFQKALRRFGAYHEMVRGVLREAGLPEDIQYLPFVESAYNPFAYSRVGAAGLWQIMPRTGRNLGLRLNATVDERLDPEVATHAAAKYLVNSERRLRAAADPAFGYEDIYPFVITSYNYGVSGMRKSIDRFGLDFDRVIEEYKSPRFQIAVKNFYASFLGARHVARNANRYFGDVSREKPLRYQTHVLQRAASIERLTKVFDLKQGQLKALNPALTRYIWNGWRFVPGDYRLRLPWHPHGWQRQIARLEKLSPQREQLDGVRYKVRKGDTACAIARAFQVNCQRLMATNDIGRNGFIRIGQRLTVPSARGGGSAARAAKAIATGSGLQYKVRRGDTVCAIALRHKIDCGVVLSANSLGQRSPIYPGQELRLLVASKPALPELPVLPPLPPLPLPLPTVIVTASEKNEAPKVVDSRFLIALDRPMDYTVYKRDDGESFYIIVLPDESLGFYADWIGLGKTNDIRKLNGFGRRSTVRIGQSILLPWLDETSVRNFQEQRQDYHGVLAEAFKENFRIETLEQYRVVTGDSLWRVSREQDVPLGVLVRFNPELVRKPLTIGQKLDVPVLVSRN